MVSRVRQGMGSLGCPHLLLLTQVNEALEGSKHRLFACDHGTSTGANTSPSEAAVGTYNFMCLAMGGHVRSTDLSLQSLANSRSSESQVRSPEQVLYKLRCCETYIRFYDTAAGSLDDFVWQDRPCFA